MVKVGGLNEYSFFLFGAVKRYGGTNRKNA